MNQFWMVYSPGGTHPPRHEHDTEAGAITECERLARHNPGQRFFVLEATEVRIVDNMRRGRFKSGEARSLDDDIPF